MGSLNLSLFHTGNFLTNRSLEAVIQQHINRAPPVRLGAHVGQLAVLCTCMQLSTCPSTIRLVTR